MEKRKCNFYSKIHFINFVYNNMDLIEDLENKDIALRNLELVYETGLENEFLNLSSDKFNNFFRRIK